jgi:four helix bundle protein
MRGTAVASQSYQDLIVWQKAMDLVEQVYHATYGWPKNELYGLMDQVRRSSVSVPANVAEGQGRGGRNEFLHFLTIANGSLYELETHLLIAKRLQYLDELTCASLMQQAAEVGRLLHGLMRRLRTTNPKTTPADTC